VKSKDVFIKKERRNQYGTREGERGREGVREEDEER
jgi:hypothetical protein